MMVQTYYRESLGRLGSRSVRTLTLTEDVRLVGSHKLTPAAAATSNRAIPIVSPLHGDPLKYGVSPRMLQRGSTAAMAL